LEYGPAGSVREITEPIAKIRGNVERRAGIHTHIAAEREAGSMLRHRAGQRL
jgi:hypothetical protein